MFRKIAFSKTFNLIKGFAAIIFGIILLLFSRFSLISLAIAFAVFALIAGVLIITFSFFIYKKTKAWVYWLVEGIVNLITGIFILSYPQIAVSFFIVIAGIWIVFMGAILLILYRKSLRMSEKSNALLYWGLILTVTGIFFVFNPFESAMAISVAIGFLSILYGLLSIFYSSSSARKYF